MLGAFYGLSAALTWGAGNVLIKSQVGKLATTQLLTVRAVAGAATAVLAYFFLGKNDALLLLTPLAWMALVGSMLTGYFGSDLLFVYALKELPLSYIFPIQATYPLIATGLAWFIYGEAISPWVFIGAVLVIAGVSLKGGVGRVELVALAAVFLLILTNAMDLLRIDPRIQTIFLGIIVVLAVALDELAKRKTRLV